LRLQRYFSFLKRANRRMLSIYSSNKVTIMKRIFFSLILLTMCFNTNSQVFYDKDSAFATGKDVVMLFSSSGCACTPALIDKINKDNYAVWRTSKIENWFADKMKKVTDSIVNNITYSHYEFKPPLIAIIHYNHKDTVFLIDTPSNNGQCSKYVFDYALFELSSPNEIVAKSQLFDYNQQFHVNKMDGTYIGYTFINRLSPGIYIIRQNNRSKKIAISPR